MPTRKAPPGRTSISHDSVVKPCGPHQRAACSGSIHAWNTSRRGASRMRLTTSSRSAKAAAASDLAAALLLRVMVLFLPLQFAKMVFQAIQRLPPEAAIGLEPVGGVLQRRGLEPAWPPLRLATTRDQAGALQHLEVLGDGGKAHGKGL